MNVRGNAWRGATAVGAGLLLAAAFPPLSGSEAAWVAFVPLLILAGVTAPVRSFAYGFLSGTVFWLCTLAWLIALGRTGAPWPLAILGWLLLSLYCALYTGLFLYLASHLLRRMAVSGRPGPTVPGWRPYARQCGLVALLPLGWVGLEYARSTLMTGFPWNALGISQYRHAGLIQTAEWGGVYAVSALVMMVNVALLLTGLRFFDVCVHRRSSRFHPELGLALLAVVLTLLHGARAVGEHGRRACPDGTRVTIRAIQPNIPQVKKWPEGFADYVYGTLRDKTELAGSGAPDLIVWPETAVPGLVKSDPATARFVRSLARQGTPILVGGMELDEQAYAEWRRLQALAADAASLTASGETWVPRYYNSAFLFNARGEMTGRYRKRHLVPFGEYLPFDRHVEFIRRLAPLGFSCRAGEEIVVFRLAPRAAGAGEEVSFSALICFEDVFAYLARDAVRAGARFLVNQTNVAWFDGTSASVQHLSHAVFRCVENRVPMARSANTGVTGFINRAGQIDPTTRALVAEGRTDQGEVRSGQLCVEGPDKALTVYARFGDGIFALPCAVVAALALAFLAAQDRGNAWGAARRG